MIQYVMDPASSSNFRDFLVIINSFLFFFFTNGNQIVPIILQSIVGIFRSNSLFTGANCREAVNEGRADFTPIFLSEIPLLFQRKIIDLDVALIQVSPPDKHGFCTLGPSVDCTRSAIQNAKYIIGRVLTFSLVEVLLLTVFSIISTHKDRNFCQLICINCLT